MEEPQKLTRKVRVTPLSQMAVIRRRSVERRFDQLVTYGDDVVESIFDVISKANKALWDGEEGLLGQNVLNEFIDGRDVERLLYGPWTVTSQSNDVPDGMRLAQCSSQGRLIVSLSICQR